MKVCIYGLGYVGCVSAACLADEGVEVVGVDTNPQKVETLGSGLPTVIEPRVAEMLRDAHRAGRVVAVEDPGAAVAGSDASIICVGTPSTKNGHLDCVRIFEVAERIGRGLRGSAGFHVVFIRSTVLPGTNRRVGALIEESSGRPRGDGFEVVSYPEFLREGTAVADYFEPPLVVVGTDSARALEVARELNANVRAPISQTSIEVAELIKLVSNSFHALKVSFANEVGNICKALGVDSHALMDTFCRDRKLNISEYYLRPGFAYGGSCLPKDLKALETLARDRYVQTPVLSAVAPSNELQKRRLVTMVEESGLRRIGVLGLSFKPNTDDLRESPMVEVVETLLGKGYTLRIYDRDVHLARLLGTNRQYIQQHIPHLEEFITDRIDEVVDGSDLLVVAHREGEIAARVSGAQGKVIIDLARPEGLWRTDESYHGICW